MKKIFVLLLTTALLLTGCADSNSGVNENGAVVENSDTEVPEVTESAEVEESEESVKIDPSELSDDLWSCDVLVNGILYHVPMWYSELEALGWEYSNRGETIPELQANSVSQDPNPFYNGENHLYGDFYNLSINKKPYTECAVSKLVFDLDNLAEGTWEIYLPAGIQMGVSTKADILAAYGEPYQMDASDEECSIQYQKSYYDNIWFEIEGGVLTRVNIAHSEELEGADNTVSADLPETVKNYKAPEVLGDSLEGATFELNGNLYSLPCPVPELVKNGITLEAEYSGIVVPANSTEYVVFSYNGSVFSTMVRNCSPNATTTDNCFLVDFEISSDATEFNLVTAGGLTRGTPVEEVLTFLQDYEYKEDVVTDSLTTYRVELSLCDYAYKEKYSFGVKDGQILYISMETSKPYEMMMGE